MKNCTDYMELISVYADDELTEIEKQQVEEHLKTCDSCSALLELYREISVASIESNVPVPEELCGSVMEKVLNESISGTGDNVIRLKRFRTVLTKYAPVAACLAVILLALPFLTNRGMFDNISYTNEMAAPVASPAIQDFSVIPPAAAPEAPAAPASDQDEQTRRTTTHENWEDQILPEPTQEGFRIDGEGETTLELPVPMQPMDNSPLTGTGSNELPPADLAVEADDSLPAPAPMFPFAPTDPAAPADPADQAEAAKPSESSPGGESAPDDAGYETDRFMTFFNHAFARVTVTGDFPEILLTYEPESYGSWMGWDRVFVMPHTTLDELVSDLSISNKVEVTRNDNDSKYIVVMYTHSG